MDLRRLALKALYWLAVLIVSLVIVFLLVLLFESLDDSSVDQGYLGSERTSVEKTTIRLAAL
jgi:hypothetical protein